MCGCHGHRGSGPRAGPGRPGTSGGQTEEMPHPDFLRQVMCFESSLRKSGNKGDNSPVGDVVGAQAPAPCLPPRSPPVPCLSPPLAHRETGNCWVQHRRQPQWDNGPGAPHGSRGTLQEDPGLWRPVVTSYSKTACLSTGTGPLCRSLVAEVPAGRVSTQGDVLRLRNRTLASSGARSPGDPAPAVTKAEPGSQNFSKLIMNAKRSSCRPLGQEDSSVLRGQPRGPRTCMSGPTRSSPLPLHEIPRPRWERASECRSPKTTAIFMHGRPVHRAWPPPCRGEAQAVPLTGRETSISSKAKAGHPESWKEPSPGTQWVMPPAGWVTPSPLRLRTWGPAWLKAASLSANRPATTEQDLS